MSQEYALLRYVEESGIEFLYQNNLKQGDVIRVDGKEYIFLSYAYRTLKYEKNVYNGIFVISKEKGIKESNNLVIITKESKCENIGVKDLNSILKLQLMGKDKLFYENDLGYVTTETKEVYIGLMKIYIDVNNKYARVTEPKYCNVDGKEYVLLGLGNLADTSQDVLATFVELYDARKKLYKSDLLMAVNDIRKMSMFQKMKYKKIAKKRKLVYLTRTSNLIEEELK